MSARSCIALIAGLALGAALAAGAAGGVSVAPVLTLTYTAGNTLAVEATGGSTLSAGSPTGLVPPGLYQVVIIDDASDATDPVHMLHLSGPGVNLMTDLQGGDDKSEIYAETLAPNATYAFQDDDIPSLPAVVFKTTSTPAPTVSAPVSTPQPTGVTGGQTQTSSSIVGSKVVPEPFRGTLDASVTARGTLTLVHDRKGVSTLKAGRYRIAVSDRSTKAGFVIEEIRKTAHTLTGEPFVGKRTATLDLQPGQWFFYSTFVGRKSYFIVVA